GRARPTCGPTRSSRSAGCRRRAGTRGWTPSRSQGPAAASACSRTRRPRCDEPGRAGTLGARLPLLGLRPRRELETALVEHPQRLLPPLLAQHCLECRREEQSMRDNREEELLHILRDDVVAAVHERPAAGGALERERGANRGAQV